MIRGIKFLQHLPISLRAAVATILFFVAMVLMLGIFFLIRLTLIKLGKDEVTAYKQYNNQFLEIIKKIVTKRFSRFIKIQIFLVINSSMCMPFYVYARLYF